jgi:hypothetical protein
LILQRRSWFDNAHMTDENNSNLQNSSCKVLRMNFLTIVVYAQGFDVSCDVLMLGNSNCLL